MGSLILDDIRALRVGLPLRIDAANTNRYLIAAEEEDGSHTAYCFAVPIYARDGKLLTQKFHENAGAYDAEGSSAELRVSDCLTLQDQNGFYRFVPECGFVPERVDGSVLYGSGCTVVPTTNGFALKVRCDRGACRFRLQADCDTLEIKGNNKCFSLMREEFRPVVTVSGIGSVDRNGGLIAPVLLEYMRESANSFLLSFLPQSPYACAVLLEINLYEPKLFQDTTVESRSADVNNVYGGTAFLGETASFGEQWLYSRPDFEKLPELAGAQIQKVVLHMNMFNNGVRLGAFHIGRRFCSFGSTWNNRAAVTDKFADSEMGVCRQSIDLTALTVDQRSGRLRQTDGFVIKALSRGGFCAIATGDSFFAPQILEVKYR